MKNNTVASARGRVTGIGFSLEFKIAKRVRKWFA